MCGIIGYVGVRPCRDILFQGLRKLEYRGYDSAGLSIVRDGQFELVHSVGNLDIWRPSSTGWGSVGPWVSLTRGGPRTDGHRPRTPIPHGLHRAFRDRPQRHCGETT